MAGFFDNRAKLPLEVGQFKPGIGMPGAGGDASNGRRTDHGDFVAVILDLIDFKHCLADKD
jgi:hypothetical protein